MDEIILEYKPFGAFRVLKSPHPPLTRYKLNSQLSSSQSHGQGLFHLLICMFVGCLGSRRRTGDAGIVEEPPPPPPPKRKKKKKKKRKIAMKEA